MIRSTAIVWAGSEHGDEERRQPISRCSWGVHAGALHSTPTPSKAIPQFRRAAEKRQVEHYLDDYGFQVQGPVYIPKTA